MSDCRLNCGAGRDIQPGWLNLDREALPGIDIVFDLDRCAETPLPLADDSVDEFLLSHLIEHIRNPLPMMQELWRVARPGACMVVRCPYGSSDDAWEDPQHVRPYFLNSFGYFSQPFYWRADYGYRGDWQPDRITLICRGTPAGLTAQKMLEKIHRERNVVQEMNTELIALKPAREPRRELQLAPKVRIAFAPGE